MSHPNSPERFDLPSAEEHNVRNRRPSFFGITNKRYSLVILVYFGFVISFAVDTNNIEYVTKIYIGRNVSDTNATHMMDCIHSQRANFFIFHLIQIPVGILSYKFSATDLFGYCIIGSTIVSFVTMWFENYCCDVTVLQSVIQAATQPVFYSIWRYWAPPSQHSTLVTLGFSGVYSGALLGYLLNPFFNGYIWHKIVAYCTMSIGWYLLWDWLILEHPIQHPHITEQEYVKLKPTIDLTNKKPAIPWLLIFKTKSVWALFFATFARSLSWVYFQHQQSVYFGWENQFLFISLTRIVSVVLAGHLADCIPKSTTISITKIRKIYISGGSLTTCLLLISRYQFTQINEAFATLSLLVLFSIIDAGLYANHLDVATRYAGITISLANVLSMFPFCGNWNFYDTWFIVLAIIVQILGILIYWCFGSGEQPTWAKPICTMKRIQSSTRVNHGGASEGKNCCVYKKRIPLCDLKNNCKNTSCMP